MRQLRYKGTKKGTTMPAHPRMDNKRAGQLPEELAASSGYSDRPVKWGKMGTFSGVNARCTLITMKTPSSRPSLTLVLGLILLVMPVVTGCNRSDIIGPLKANILEFTDVAAEGDTLKVLVSSERDFVSTSSVPWLTTNLPLAASRNKITITVGPNLTEEPRSGTVTFATTDDQEGEKESIEVKVQQRPRDASFAIDSVLYEIPLIFHVITNPEDIAKKDAQNNDEDPNNDYTKVTASSLQKLVAQVNQLYAGVAPYPDRNMIIERYSRLGLFNSRIRFVLATKDPEGKTLSPAGIDTHNMSDKSIDPQAVMGDKKGGTYHSMSYPIDRYINVYIFPFKAGTDVSAITLGISHMPYMAPGHEQEGLQVYDRVVPSFDNYNHCVTINYLQFEDRIARSQLNYNVYRQTFPQPAMTLAHELGHYLGLGHVFAEKKKDESGSLEMVDDCLDSDYVEDTPTYNRVAYNKVMLDQIAAGQGGISISVLTSLLSRDFCDGQFNQPSLNLMDYEVSYSDRFTRGQVDRMRRVLYYSYTVPGDKLVSPTRSIPSSAPAIGHPVTAVCIAPLIPEMK